MHAWSPTRKFNAAHKDVRREPVTATKSLAIDRGIKQLDAQCYVSKSSHGGTTPDGDFPLQVKKT